MATTDMCQICYDDKLVLPCGAMGVCDKKICMSCNLKFRNYKCVFCFQEQPKFRVVFEMEDRFNWACGQGPRGIDAYISRYNSWYLEFHENEEENENNEYEVLRQALENENNEYDPFGEISNP